MRWSVPKIWQGGTAWIIGGGPSITEEFNIPKDVVQSVVEGKSPVSAYSPYMAGIHDKHVIGVNIAYMLGDWVDMVFFGDYGFFLKHEVALSKFPNLRISSVANTDAYNWVKFLRRNRRMYGICTIPSQICWNGNSGCAAINIAANTGAKRIILLGFDMTLNADGKHHWHGVYRKGGEPPKARLRTKNGILVPNLPFKRHSYGFDQIALDAKTMGIEIINASQISTITQFPKVTVKELLKNGY